MWRWTQTTRGSDSKNRAASEASTAATSDDEDDVKTRHVARPKPREMTETALATTTVANATMASQMMWRLAMRMSLQNESRLLQHFSRSMLGVGNHKHPERKQSVEERVEMLKLKSKSIQPTKTLTASQSSSTTESEISDFDLEPEHVHVQPRDPSFISHPLPPLPPLVFSPSKNFYHLFPGLSFKNYQEWPISGVRPGFSVRIVRTEAVGTVQTVTEYVVHVVDLHTKVFWIVKKRFNDFYLLRKKIRDMIRGGSTSEIEQLRFITELPFPRRRFRHASSDAVVRRMREIELFLRNVAALEPTTKIRVNILREFQLSMCSAEFISSLEKIDTTGEPPEPKWLTYDLFMSLNSVGCVEGHTCCKFVQAFRNRCAVIEAAICPECYNFADVTLATEALRDLRSVLTSIEKHVAEHLDSKFADRFSLLDPSADVTTAIDDVIYRAVEDTVLVPLEQEITFLVEQTIDADQELRLARNMEKWRGRPQSDFGIPEYLQSDDDWGKSCHHLSMVDERQLPADKIHELLRSALEIFKSCGEKNLDWCVNSGLTADDYLPIHIYVVIHSGLKRPLMTKEYIGAMIHPSKMMGEVGYFLTMFEVALQYIADM
ncbi:hypothetical protein Poli38472_006324 [Pythium oligandrum]|uniref:VPS9 domain-containing protein n=1 Tax=Pythium oligandrum TaxID=41045 RepID=A0A8K1C4I7_PYTOL|nr:hypothetical protein Poli38472_006324 [Pythium oligandrum]|eukprot:TMW56314.1 hypothetical protein Poli38472_006324 [Pythium oligandrum]